MSFNLSDILGEDDEKPDIPTEVIYGKVVQVGDKPVAFDGYTGPFDSSEDLPQGKDNKNPWVIVNTWYFKREIKNSFVIETYIDVKFLNEINKTWTYKKKD